MTGPSRSPAGAPTTGFPELATADLAEIGRIEVRGQDRVEFLHRILACAVTDLSPGAIRPGCLLTPKGRVRALFLLGAGESAHRLDVEARFAPGLARAIEAFHFGERVEIEDVSARTRAIGVLGPASPRALAAIGIAELPARGRFSRTSFEGTETEAARLDAIAEPFFVLRAPADRAAAVAERLRASIAGARVLRAEEIEALRIEAGIPRYGVDVDETHYPHEASIEGACSISKGCYPGQEVAARLTTYQGFKRRPVLLAFDGEEPPPTGAGALAEDGSEVGTVTSCAFSPGLRRAIALAIVQKEAAVPGTKVRVDAAGRTWHASVRERAVPCSLEPGR